MIDKLTFRAFRAINEPETCQVYLEGHVNVLKDYGITNVTSNNNEWMHNPNIYCVIAILMPENEIVGGIRIQISDKDNLLPVEKAIGGMDPRIYDIVKDFRNDGGVGELSGLWNAKKVAGIGLSLLLTRASISTANQLNFTTMIGICAEYTLAMFRRVGFVVNNNLGLKGEFPYPNQNYIARVLGIMNAATLETAEEIDKVRMKSLRENPIQTTIEIGAKDPIQIEYNLTYKL